MRKTFIAIFITLMIIFSYKSIAIEPYIFEKKYSSAETTNWAVIITVGEPDRDSKSAQDLYDILKNNGWDEDKIRYLKESEATKDAILNISDWLNGQGMQDDDLVIFYFSMHGIRRKDTEPFDEPDGLDELIVPFKSENQDENIVDDELALMFDEIQNDNLVIIFETCYSGGMIDGDCDLKKSGRIIITSAKEDETSYPIFLKRNWLFPHFFILGLRGKADKNHDGHITAEESYRYAELRTKLRSTIYGILLFIFHKALFNQHPQIYDGWPTNENNNEELKLISL